ncbi:HlyD family type I secretion periplasmic adaptor subunit [Methylorubrum salsuginis]|uniref:Membrane fusion protein (MFP) family protein n=1 Tax=Methylorubrum salsuginis TaxID=414703 RepID=A0A1I4CWR5_9HYPH|nr:HlyD family type I secretion periplasmic adaptor subunit [Methylorubrum salsuginis]SFK84436.1 HlyD family secretion protein [Methylorubrum salsuginis]
MRLRRPKPPDVPSLPPARRARLSGAAAWTRRTVDGAVRARAALREEPQDLDALFAERPPGAMRGTLYGVVGLVAALTLAASLVKVDIIVSSSGRLLADAPNVVLQPLQLSIIRELRVKAGDTVRKGDVLARLDPTFAQADRGALVAQQEALRAELERLEAELADQPPRFTGEGPDVALQTSLYRQRRSQFEAQLRSFDAEIARLTGSFAAAGINARSAELQFDVYSELEQMYSQLYRKTVASRVQYLGASVSRLKAERDRQEESNRRNELENQLAAKRAERQVFADRWRSELMEALVKARKEAKGVAESLVKANRMNDLVVLTAPEDGVVLDLARRSVGSVVQPAEPVLTLLPLDAPLFAEVMIGAGDAGYAKPGDEVMVKLDAFPYQRHGTLSGRLRSVRMETAQAPGAGPNASVLTHRGQVELTGDHLRALPEGTRPIPGMSVTAEIKVGTRSVISYFIYPLIRGFDESIREP